MGKRKFVKPEESDSEYEWEEAPPRKQKSPEITKCESDLSEFLDAFTTKSSKDLRKESKEKEKVCEDKAFKDRLCVQKEVEPQQADSSWLKRVYYRIQDVSKSTGEDSMTLLKERYDEKTINMMINLCERNNSRAFSHDDKLKKKSYMNKNNSYSEQRKCFEESDDFQTQSKKKSLTDNKNFDDKEVEERYVTNIDLNEVSASLLKAEISNDFQKTLKLKKKLDILREAQRRNLKIRLTRPKKEVNECNSVMIEKTLKNGRMVPYMETGNKFQSQSIFNDQYSSGIDKLIREEHATNAYDNDWAFASMASKASTHRSRYEDTGEREYDGVIEPNRRQVEKSVIKDKHRAIESQKKRTTQISSCKRCYKNMSKHLILSKGEYFSLILPPDLGITNFHWQLIPIDHVATETRLDDDSFNELISFKKRIAEFYTKELSSECIFMETAVGLKDHPHMVIDCIPMTKSRDTFSFSNKIFFKKAIDEAKSEWCQNKKIIEMSNGDIRRNIPKEFPYFAVEFDRSEGLAFVIDDERKFSPLFGLEIVGSLLDKSEIEIKSRKDKHFNEQADAVLQSEKKWKRYDLWKREDSDDDSN